MSLRHAVLGLLTEGPASGYDLLKVFEASLANVWPATQSQLYGELGRLADAGLIEVVAEGPRGRKEYGLTEAGLAELRRWLIEVEPESFRRTDMLLRVFFLGVVSPEQAQAYLREQGAVAARGRESLEEIRSTVDKGDLENAPLAVYGRIALEWGLRFTAMQQEWAEWAARQVDRIGERHTAAAPGTDGSGQSRP
ncbi:PadR family transcriptional regulator [Planobispora rosea]|uniref:PadR family transcriptional regulator n=1 Tax=Planobispora rosea TaxID=35762 RepID=A0A8J3WC74_PLARO|nr:PadR family transcriptional regulator [Planobispora rosea]GGS61222.1 PadR family transcriptional regulator [Planobispora rosea]GIH83900.1 PadR family transcriptional regulator [Planobispora rosea]